MKAIKFLNTNDIITEFETLKGIIIGLIIQKDVEQALINEFIESNKIKNINFNRNINFNDKILSLRKEEIDSFIEEFDKKVFRVKQDISRFVDYFENSNIESYLLKIEKLLETEISFSSKKDLNVRLQGYNCIDIKDKMDYLIKTNITRYILSQKKLRQLESIDFDKTKIQKVINPVLVNSFIKFEKELIDEKYLDSNNKWISKPTNLARLLKSLYELDYIKNKNDKFKGIKSFLEERYRFEYKLVNEIQILKPNKIHKLQIDEAKFPYSRLSILKEYPFI